jgi:hypothetical protein
MLVLSKYSMGIGDRFGQQGKAQLAAFARAARSGVEVTPVWNKSNREHQIVGTRPEDVRAEADAAVRALGWRGAYRVDADHIGLKNVDGFVAASDFFTLDVADFTGRAAEADSLAAFVRRHARFAGRWAVPGIEAEFVVTPAQIEAIARKYLLAVQEAGRLYRHIASRKGADGFVTEVSMDETDQPQTPLELFFILAAVAGEGIPAQTIAPKFTGRFNKGVDYEGDRVRFEREFNDDLCVLAFAVREFGLPPSLKLSVHSGSDKFSLYAPIHRALRRHGAGLHIKTAGTTWLEELVGLAAAGGRGLDIAKAVYAGALARFDEMGGPYAAVIAIDRTRLPAAETVAGWSATEFVESVRHDIRCSRFNPHLRQLLHVGYKIAAEMGPRYLDAVRGAEASIAGYVTENVFERHLNPVFLGPAATTATAPVQGLAARSTS